jgi:hypothetical protein
MDEKIASKQLLQARCHGERKLFFPPREKGIKLLWKATSLEEQVPECLTRKFKGQILFKLNIIYTIGKIFKCTHLKWSCILDLRLWI